MLEKLSGRPTIKLLNILVYGFYHKNNIGDDLFAEAFKYLFPNYNFIFTDYISIDHLYNIDAVFIGGGSFLNYPINTVNDLAFRKLQEHKIFYLGVGGETDIHPTHHHLMSIAQLIALRSMENLSYIKNINFNTIVIPDLVFCLPNNNMTGSKLDKSVLILPNITTVPAWDEPHWKHAAWDFFKTEFSQFIEWLLESKHNVKFLSMCSNINTNDNNAAIEIINRMKYGNKDLLLDIPTTDNIMNIISKYRYVITQRYHGAILAEKLQVPYLGIYHHNKLKMDGNCLSFYGVSKDNLIKTYQKKYIFNNLPIDSNIFKELIQKVDYALCHC